MNRLSAGYDSRQVLKDVSLTVSEGESVALIGPNGCGKSTLLRSIVGLLKTTAGEVRVNGESLCEQGVYRRIGRGIGYLKQTENTFAGLTVFENLDLATGACDSSKVAARRRAEILSAFPMLAAQAKTRAGLLSGGQKQALAVAMVMMRPASLLLLDEPVAGLSPNLGMELLEAVGKFQRAATCAVIIVEHRLQLVHSHVDRVLVMRQGALVDDTYDTDKMLDASWISAHYDTTGCDRS